jgi:4-hydroxy-3-methylbut-2-enyl diphosphate reductase
VSQTVRKQAQDIGAIIYDATCPLVTKVHKEVTRKQKQNHNVILIGHEGHPEVEGTLGQSSGDQTVQLVETVSDVENLEISTDDISYTTQTTLSVDDTQKIVQALKEKFPNIQAPKKDDICYATQNRQDAVKALMGSCDVLLVLGSNNSSNSNRLKEIAKKMNKPAYLIDGIDDIDVGWIEGVETVGVTAGASAPEILVQEVVDCLLDKGATEVVEVSGVKEDVHFPVPGELR